MYSHAAAIVWAQWRTLRNYLPRSSKAGLAFTILISVGWYGGFVTLAAASALLMADPGELDVIAKILPGGLMLAFLYWQLMPVLMVSMGSSLDIKKLLAYPIPTGQLFAIETVLRITTGIEVVIVLTGTALGLLFNPRIPAWAPLSLAVFTLFNQFLSVGVRDLLSRLLARKWIREAVAFAFVILAALPQLLFMTGVPGVMRRWFVQEPLPLLPWTATAHLARGHFAAAAAGALLAWTAAAYAFGRWQFERGLRFDATEAASSNGATNRRAGPLEALFRLPSAIFSDPLGALIEKELRTLVRLPRFRLVFMMGFSFGLLIWAPLVYNSRNSPDGWAARNYLSLVSVYALLLLADALFWNVFGFDRGAAQIYFLVPVNMRTVLLSKNLAAGFFVMLELTAVIVVCAIVRLPLGVAQFFEALSVTLLVTMFLAAIGNLSSMYNPNPVDASKSWNAGSRGRTQAMMFSVPLALLPVVLAYAARYAFDSEPAFFGVIALGLFAAALVYRISMESAVQAAARRTEQIAGQLSRGGGPIEG